MPRLVALSLAVLLAGCVTQELDSHGSPIQRGPSDEIVVDGSGRLVVRPTRIIPPTTIIVNGGTPTEREIKLLGVEGLPEREAPITYATLQTFYAKYVAKEEQIYVKPALATDFKQRTIWGVVYLQMYRELENGELQIIPDRYGIVNMYLLSLGLVKMRNPLEIEDEQLRARMIAVEKQAKELKRGLWSDTP